MDDIIEYAGKLVYVILLDDKELTGVLQPDPNGNVIHLELDNGDVEHIELVDVAEYGLA